MTAGCRWNRAAKPSRPAGGRPLELAAGAGVGDGQDVLAAQLLPARVDVEPPLLQEAVARARSRPGWRAATGRSRPAPAAPRRAPAPRRAAPRRCAPRAPSASKRAEERPSTSTADCAAVCRERSVQSPPKTRPGPALPTSRCRPTLISKASVAGMRASARPPRPAAPRRPSAPPPARRPAARSPWGAAASAAPPAAARPAPGRAAPASPAPPPWKRATPPSPIRSGRITGTARTIACRCGAIACWPALSSSRAVQMSSVSTSARSSGARDGVPPSASTSASASAAISASAAAWPGVRQHHPAPDQPRQRAQPRQPLRRLRPGPREVALVRRERPPEAVRPAPVQALGQQRRMHRPALRPPPGRLGLPARAAAGAEAVDPVLHPGLRQHPRRPVAERGEVVEPEAGLPLRLQPRGRGAARSRSSPCRSGPRARAPASARRAAPARARRRRGRSAPAAPRPPAAGRPAAPGAPRCGSASRAAAGRSARPGPSASEQGGTSAGAAP